MINEKLKVTHVMTHSLRHKILIELSKKKMYSTELAELLKINRRLVSFHLTTLLNVGLITGNWQVSKIPKSKGKAAKYFELTPEAKKLLNQITDITFP